MTRPSELPAPAARQGGEEHQHPALPAAHLLIKDAVETVVLLDLDVLRACGAFQRPS